MVDGQICRVRVYANDIVCNKNLKRTRPPSLAIYQ